jgi:uncharacterized OsmC-like protein
MSERYVTAGARSYSSGTRGRCITSARTNHFVVDDADYSGGPNEAITPAEAFLSGITACAVLMLERLAREGDIPLVRSDISVEATRDREAVHEVHSAYDRVRMTFELVGPSQAQARGLVESYKRR